MWGWVVLLNRKLGGVDWGDGDIGVRMRRKEMMVFLIFVFFVMLFICLLCFVKIMER